MQDSILSDIPRAARYLSFNLRPGADPAAIRESVQNLESNDGMIVGIGAPLVSLWGGSIEGLRTFPALSGPDMQVPSTQHALWCWLRCRLRF